MSLGSLHKFPDLFEVDFKPGTHNSGLKSLVAFKQNQAMAPLTGMSRVPIKTWSSVQYGPGENNHIEFNSVLVYANHSCSPNSIIDVSSEDPSEWNFRALKDISPGDYLTWFYPSTEWISPTPFDCWCKEHNCIGRMKGSRYLTRAEVEERGFINRHIVQLMEERDGDSDDSAQNTH